MSDAQKEVNQQLAWCATLTRQFEGERAPWLEEALVQSLTWHLQLAYCAFLQELASSQRFNAERSISIVTLIASVPSGRGCPIEFEELKALELGDSWLSRLLSKSTNPPTAWVAGGSTQVVDVIAVSGSASWGMIEVQKAQRQLTALIERNRSLGQEY